MRKWLIVLLMVVTLACNFPGFPEFGSETPETDPIAETATPETGDEAPAENRATPAPLESPTPEGFTATPTPSPTLTPSPTPTPTLTPTTTSQAVQPGPPLAFQEPAWEIAEWQQIPETSDWEGTIRLRITGGTAPYRAQLENQPVVDGLLVPARWRICSAMPATVRVWSADGQRVETKIWVPGVGCVDN